MRFIFLHNLVSDVVHLIDDVPSWQQPEETSTVEAGEIMLNLMLGRTTARCGAVVTRNRGGLEQSGTLTNSFADEQLCRRCHATLKTEDEIVAAFEHDQP